MRIVIEKDWDIIFDFTEESALAPIGQSERAIVFHALTSALAFISGITPQQTFLATGVAMDAHFLAIEQYREARKSGNVVHLRGPRDNLIDDANS